MRRLETAGLRFNFSDSARDPAESRMNAVFLPFVGEQLQAETDPQEGFFVFYDDILERLIESLLLKIYHAVIKRTDSRQHDAVGRVNIIWITRYLGFCPKKFERLVYGKKIPEPVVDYGYHVFSIRSGYDSMSMLIVQSFWSGNSGPRLTFDRSGGICGATTCLRAISLNSSSVISISFRNTSSDEGRNPSYLSIIARPSSRVIRPLRISIEARCVIRLMPRLIHLR